jgi:hypothetical protein
LEINTMPPIRKLGTTKLAPQHAGVVRQDPALLHDDKQVGIADGIWQGLPENIPTTNTNEVVAGFVSPLQFPFVVLALLAGGGLSVDEMAIYIPDTAQLPQAIKEIDPVVK